MAVGPTATVQMIYPVFFHLFLGRIGVRAPVAKVPLAKAFHSRVSWSTTALGMVFPMFSSWPSQPASIVCIV